MKSIPLSPIDGVFLGTGTYPLQFLFYYPQGLDADQLARGLNTLRGDFWPLFGTLRRDATGVHLDSTTKKAVDFFHEEKSEIKTLLNFADPCELNPYAIDIHVDDGAPLSAFKVIHLPKGSLLSANVAHCLVDGYSFFYFLSYWAGCARGRKDWLTTFKTRLFMRPHHRRDRINASANSLSLRGWDDGKLADYVFAKTGLSLSPQRRNFSLATSRWTYQTVSKTELMQSFGFAGNSKPQDHGLSWHDLLATKLWRQRAQEWTGPKDASLSLASAYDFRRLKANLGQRYIGNAVRACGVRLKRDAILSTAPLEVARIIRQSIISIDTPAIDETIAVAQALARDFGEDIASRMHVADPERGLMVTNLSRLPVNSLDFGSGAPTEVVAMTPAPHAAIVTSDPVGFKVRLSSST